MFRFHGLKNLHTNDQLKSCPLYNMNRITIGMNGTNPRGVRSTIHIFSAFSCRSVLPMKIHPKRYHAYGLNVGWNANQETVGRVIVMVASG